LFHTSSLCVSTTSFVEEADDDEEEESSSLTLSQGEKLSLRKKLNHNFMTIAAPAFVQLTSEPLASLVDTAYLGRLGPEVLGGAGMFYPCSVLFLFLFFVSRSTDSSSSFF
jgi:Na+-driven multidrug efflux pump